MGCQCSSFGMLSSELNYFFEFMQIRKFTHEHIVSSFKSKWKGGLSPENWGLFVNSTLSKHYDGVENENYKKFWTDIYAGNDVKYLIISILFLCEKHTVQMKQNFENLCKGIFKFKDQFVQASDGYKTYVKKEFLKNVLVEYISVLSSKCINLAPQFKNDNTSGRKALNDVYSPKIIEAFAQSILKNLDSEIKKKRIKIEYEGFTDFDEFFEITYAHLLHDDKEVRRQLDEFGVDRINNPGKK